MMKVIALSALAAVAAAAPARETVGIATRVQELEAQLAVNQSHLYFYWVNKAADRCGEVDAAPFHAEGPVRTKPHIAAPGVR